MTSFQFETGIRVFSRGDSHYGFQVSLGTVATLIVFVLYLLGMLR